MPGWLKGCAIGCGLFLLISVVTFVGCGWSMMKPFKDAQVVREDLEAAYGEQGDYVPPADGRVAPDRLEVFLAVQQDLADQCEGFAATFGHFEKVEQMDDESTSSVEKFGLVLGAVGRGMGLPRLLGRYNIARNTALLEHGMGLGEYTYIYAVGYYGVLGRRGHVLGEESGVEINVEDGHRASRRLRRVLRGMLQEQLAALDAAGGDPELLTALRDEVTALEDDAERLPWQDGAPESIAASFAPYRDRMTELWCAYADEFALQVARQGNKGFSITSD